MKKLLLLLIAVIFAATSTWAQTSDYFNGFETTVGPGDWETVTIRADGYNGISASTGSFYADATTNFTRFGGYNYAFPTYGYRTSLDIYLNIDGGYANDKRFDYTSAISSLTDHRRDFVFNGGFYNDATPYGVPNTNRFIISASNNGAGWPGDPSRTPIAISSTGWYTFEHFFHDNGSGVLAVDLYVYNSANVLMGSWTLSDPTDIIGTTVGGNRYGWFARNQLGSLPIDNSSLTLEPSPYPEPITTIEPSTPTVCGNYDFQVKVQDFINVGAISLVLDYDITKLDYVSFTQNTLFSNGIVLLENTPGKLLMSYFSNTGVTLADDEVLLTLNFNLLPSASGISTNLTWSTVTGECEYAEPGLNGQVYASTFTNLTWTVPLRPVKNTNTGLEYCKIQDAIDATQTLDGHTITVAAGDYAEVLYIYKELDIQGPNYGINPNTGTRNPEARIKFPASNTSWYLVYIDGDGDELTTLSDVSLSGFEFDGVDSYGGASPTELIFIAGAENVTIKNNILKNFEMIAIHYYYQYWDGTNWVPTWPIGVDISNNQISNPDFYSLGSIAPNTGIYVQGCYGSVMGNTVQDVLGGCQIQPYGHPNTTLVTGTVTGNTFLGSRNGLWYNNSSNTNADWLFSENTLSGVPLPSGYTPGADWYGEPTNIWYGFAINGNSYGELTFTGNTIEKGSTGFDAYGIRYVHGYTHAPKTAITNNFINDLAYGVYLPVNLLNVDEIVISDNSISGNTMYGVYNGTLTAVTATCNWWGTNTVAGVSAEINGPVTYIPWLIDGDDSGDPGFVPDGPCTGAENLYVNDLVSDYPTNDIYTTAIGSDANPGTAAAPFLTITKAVNTAVDGTKIWVDAGTFQEQVIIGKTLDITGVDRTKTIVKAPATLTGYSNANGTSYAIIYADGNANTINIDKILVDGDNGRANSTFTGVHYYAANGAFTNSRITGIRDNPYSGAQGGTALTANHQWDVSVNQTVYVTDNIIDDYQKGGIVINELNTQGIVTGNVVIGQNIPNVNGQNGIQFGFGSYGTITNNTLTNNIWNAIEHPHVWTAAGILLVGVGVDNNGNPTGNATIVGDDTFINDNDLSGNEVGLSIGIDNTYGYNNNANLTVYANTFSNNKAHVWGLSAAEVSASNVYDKRVDNPAQTNIVFGCIQYAIDEATSGDVLNASIGTFEEQVVVHTSVDLRGPKYGVSGYDVSRGTGEAIVKFPLGLTPNAVTEEDDVVNITADDVIIDGFTVDGQNYDPLGYYQAVGIMSVADNSVIRNNRVFNSETVNIWVSSYYWDGSTWATEYRNGAVIENNYTANTDIFNRPDMAYAYGIYVQGAYGDVLNNVVEDCRAGIQIQPYNHPNSTTDVGTVSGNSFEGYSKGMYFNYSQNANGNWQFINNTVRGIAPPTGVSITEWVGIAVQTYSGGLVDFSENSITFGSAVATNKYTVKNFSTLSFNATCNWHGTDDGDLIAPMITGTVNYIPWLLDGTDNDLVTPGFQPVPGSCGGAPDLTGNYKYYNSGATPLTNINVELWKDGSKVYPASGTVTTDGTGTYTFTNVLPDTYEVRASTSKASGGINSTDAAQVNYWAINPSSIEKIRFYAGDVVLDNKVMPGDASRIQGYFLTQGSIGWAGRPDWSFWKTGDLINMNPANPNNNLVYPTTTVPSVGTTVTQNFYGLSTGDFNRSFTPSALKSGTESLTLTYGQTIEVGMDAFELPLYAGMDMTVGAVSLILNIPSDVLQVNSVYLGSEANTPVLYDVTGNELRISWYSSESQQLQTGQRLLTLVLQVIEPTGEPIYLSLATDPLNELADQDFEVFNTQLTVDVIKATALGTGDNALQNNLIFSNHPNPFVGTTSFVYTIPSDGKVLLEVFDILGNKVMVAVDEMQSAGEYLLKVDRNTLQQGIYMAVLKLENGSGTMSRTIKIISK